MATHLDDSGNDHVRMIDAGNGLLYSIVLTLSPTREVDVRATMGHQAHAAFLKTVRESDPALAEVLHMPDMPCRPFTVSPLQGAPLPQNGRIYLSPEETYWLRFTILYPPIFEQFMRRFLRGEGRPVVWLGHAVLLIKEILATPGSHPWTGHTTWEEIASGARAEEEITLDFCSPPPLGLGRRSGARK